MSIPLRKNTALQQESNSAGVPYHVTQEILRAIQDLRFGSVEIVIHDAKVVQIERKEKFRFQPEFSI
jgi:hypothetical protein